MRTRLFPIIAGILVLAAWNTPVPAARPAGKVIVIQMVDVSPTAYKYEPAVVTAQPGDTLRFTQGGAMPHNVDFKATPAGASLGAAKTGKFLTKAGETYDLVIDARFPAGAYQFACTPHEALGMKGTLTVQP